MKTIRGNGKVSEHTYERRAEELQRQAWMLVGMRVEIEAKRDELRVLEAHYVQVERQVTADLKAVERGTAPVKATVAKRPRGRQLSTAARQGISRRMRAIWKARKERQDLPGMPAAVVASETPAQAGL